MDKITTIFNTLQKFMLWIQDKCTKCGSDKTDWRGTQACKKGCDFHVHPDKK